MRHKDVIKNTFESIYESNLFIAETKKRGFINGLRLFCDKYDLYGFINNYDLLKDEYKKYYHPYVEENMLEMHNYAVNEYKKERYGIYPFRLGDDDNES